MYNVIFESENGQKYVFGADGETVFDMDLGNGVSVDIGTSQGFSQVGETVESMWAYDNCSRRHFRKHPKPKKNHAQSIRAVCLGETNF